MLALGYRFDPPIPTWIYMPRELSHPRPSHDLFVTDNVMVSLNMVTRKHTVSNDVTAGYIAYLHC